MGGERSAIGSRGALWTPEVGAGRWDHPLAFAGESNLGFNGAYARGPAIAPLDGGSFDARYKAAPDSAYFGV